MRNKNLEENGNKSCKKGVCRNSRWLIALVVLSCLGALIMGGCSTDKTMVEQDLGNLSRESMVTMDIQPEEATIEYAAAEAEGPTESSSTPFEVSKIIFFGSISLVTEDGSETTERIQKYALDLGGFVQDSGSNYVSSDGSARGNYGFISIRIPSDKFTEAMEEIEGFGQPVSTNVNSTNISQQYTDTETRLKNLKIQEERLVEYLKQAGNITELLSIETELNRVRTEIDSLTTHIKNWDTEISYSTISISIREEAPIKIDGSPFSEMTEKISDGFVTSINLVLIVLEFLVICIFRLIPFAIIGGLVFLIITWIRRNLKKRKKKISNGETKVPADENKP